VLTPVEKSSEAGDSQRWVNVRVDS
jgi:hypothetical protein